MLIRLIKQLHPFTENILLTTGVNEIADKLDAYEERRNMKEKVVTQVYRINEFSKLRQLCEFTKPSMQKSKTYHHRNENLNEERSTLNC